MKITVIVDTVPPEVDLALEPSTLGDEDDDERRFRIGFSATDVCDPSPAVAASLVAPGCSDTPVSDGQVFEF